MVWILPVSSDVVNCELNRFGWLKFVVKMW
jgi:hypothetical protein